jgi:hypothetical protein
LNLAQAVEASQEQGAYRIVGPLRILVQFGNQELRVLVQCRSKRHWRLMNDQQESPLLSFPSRTVPRSSPLTGAQLPNITQAVLY